MRGYAVIVGAIAFASWSCQLQSMAVCSPGEDRCACLVENQCNAGLTCVSGTCFDLVARFGAPDVAGTTGAAGFGMSVLPGVEPGAAGVSAAGSGSGAAGADAAAGAGAAGVGLPAAGGFAGAAAVAAGIGAVAVCAVVNGDCSATPCCEGALCLLGVCAASCKIHQDCTSGCCIAQTPELAACFDASACVAPAP